MSVPLRWEPLAIPEPSNPPQCSPLRRRRETRQHGRRFRTVLVAFSRVSLFALAVVGAWTLLQAAWKTPDLHLTPASASGGQVTLASASAERQLGYVTVSGSVQNHAQNRLAQVEAVVELLDRQNHTVKVESALVAFDPLPPGETSPFRVEVPDTDRAVAYRVRFKKLLGGALN